MRLVDLPRTVVIAGKRRQARIRRKPLVEQTYEDAHKDMLAQGKETYQQALGALVLCANASNITQVREIARSFLSAAGAKNWIMPGGVRPRNLRSRRKTEDV